MEGYIGEIRWFSPNFEPKNWKYCNGQLLSIANNSALFSILGTTYGGDGRTTFALPDFRGRTAVGTGDSGTWVLGEMQGSEHNTILISNMPSHNHTMACNSTANSGTLNTPNNAFLGTGPVDRSTGQPVNTRYAATADATMNPLAVQPIGGNTPVNNIQPSLGMNYIICIYGIYPSRN